MAVGKSEIQVLSMSAYGEHSHRPDAVRGLEDAASRQRRMTRALRGLGRGCLRKGA